MYLSRKSVARSRTIVAVQKPFVFHIFFVYASACLWVALLIQHAARVRHIVTSFVAPLVSPYFSTLSHKRHDFRKKRYWTYNVCFDIFYNFV
jgi:hypothetical protein